MSRRNERARRALDSRGVALPPALAKAATPTWTDVVGAVGASVGAIAAASALLYAGRQLQLGRRAADEQRQAGRQELAYRYFERLMRPEMIRFIVLWAEVSKLGDADPEVSGFQLG